MRISLYFFSTFLIMTSFSIFQTPPPHPNSTHSSPPTHHLCPDHPGQPTSGWWRAWDRSCKRRRGRLHLQRPCEGAGGRGGGARGGGGIRGDGRPRPRRRCLPGRIWP